MGLKLINRMETHLALVPRFFYVLTLKVIVPGLF